jgi:hypothetical protein
MPKNNFRAIGPSRSRNPEGIKVGKHPCGFPPANPICLHAEMSRVGWTPLEINTNSQASLVITLLNIRPAQKLGFLAPGEVKVRAAPWESTAIFRPAS